MRIFTLLFLTLSAFTGLAQPLIFDQTIAEKDVQTTLRLPVGLREQYSVTRYVKQPAFLGENDFYVAVTPSLVLKSKYIKTHRYPTGSLSYEGKLEGALTGTISFSKFQDRIAGLIELEDGRKFMIDQTGPSLFAISQTKDEIYIRRETAAPDFIEIGSNGLNAGVLATNICDAAATCTGPSVIDLMVVYTPDAMNKWGGEANTVTNITQAVTNMNTALTNSGVTNVTFRLVHTRLVNYVESGSFSTDLSRLAGTSDGYIDSVHIYRNQYGADMVSLIIGTPTSSCGIGYLNTSNLTYSAGSAFNVSLYSCVVGNFTMSHEFGHNMGLRHDWYVDGSTSPCSHHHGYVNQKAIQLGTGSASSARWRTIMAYNDHCSSVGISCSRLNRWSNPTVLYNSDPTGIAIGNTNPSDEAYAFYRMACQVASFRAEAPSCAAPTGLNASNIVSTSATVSWSSVTGASSYAVDYKLSTASSWTSAATSNAGTSLNVSGLSGSSIYDWRVRANCGSGNSTYAQAQFTTASLCSIPANPSTINITSSGATIRWNRTADATGYYVEYKTSASASWSLLAANTADSSIALTGLTASTTYNWRVATNCSAGIGTFATGSFTTSAPQVCSDIYESNNTSRNAKSISLGTVINAGISSNTDVDWFRFATPNTSATNIRVVLYNLPANFNIYLYDKNLIVRDSSVNTGTTNDTVIFNSLAKKATYYILIRGANGAFNTGNCYLFKAETSSATFNDIPEDAVVGTAADRPVASATMAWKVYPMPVKDRINMIISANESGPATIELHDLTGRLVHRNNIDVRSGTGNYTMDAGNIRSGMYILKLKLNEHLLTQKVIIEHQ